jgi:hypothetical protein
MAEVRLRGRGTRPMRDCHLGPRWYRPPLPPALAEPERPGSVRDRRREGAASEFVGVSHNGVAVDVAQLRMASAGPGFSTQRRPSPAGARMGSRTGLGGHGGSRHLHRRRSEARRGVRPGRRHPGPTHLGLCGRRVYRQPGGVLPTDCASRRFRTPVPVAGSRGDRDISSPGGAGCLEDANPAGSPRLSKLEPISVIAERTGKHRSAVWREVAANGGREHYRAVAAEERAARGRPPPEAPLDRGAALALGRGLPACPHEEVVARAGR